MSFRPAVRTKLRARIALCGPPKSGKSFTALRWAIPLSRADGGRGRIAVIDTEHRSASKYIGDAPDGEPFQFDVCELENFAPSSYMAEILAAGRNGYDVLIIDSLSHAWAGEGGVLAIVDSATERSRSKNKFTDGWREATPQHNRLIDSIIRSPCHVIVTMRTKMEYILEENERGQKVPRKVGLGPIQRQGMEYEFDIVGDLDWSHTLKIGETRCSAVDGLVAVKPGAEVIEPVIEWLAHGTTPPEGYYAVSEADLAASEQARREEEKLRPKQPTKRKTAKELIAEKAAASNGNGAPAAAEPGANRLTEFAQKKVDEQTAKSRAAQEAVVKGNGQATTEPAASPPTSTIDVPHDPQLTGHEERLDEPCSEPQVSQIRSLIGRLGIDATEFRDKVLVKQLKVNRLAELTKNQAIVLMERLRAEESKKQLGEKFESELAAKN